MKIAIRYYTKSGHTQKLANAIGEALHVEVKDVTHRLQEKVDILFLGSSVYAGGISNEVKSFIQSNAHQIKMIVNFSTAALAHSTYKQVYKIATQYQIKMAKDEFACRGSFGPVHKDRPNQKDIDDAISFAKDIVQKYE